MNAHRQLVAIPFLLVPLALWRAEPAQDPPAMHGMLIVGQETVYLSHLPMFQAEGAHPMPHRYQAILEVTFEKPGEEPHRTYRDDRRDHPGTSVYTLEPEEFVLPTLVAAEGAPLRSFSAAGIFRGHFEKGGVPILRDVEVAVTRVVHFRELVTGAPTPPHLEYLLFGKDDELFLAHLISGSPDFDQLLSVTAADGRLTAEQLAHGIVLRFPGTTNQPGSRLHEGQEVVGRMIFDGASAADELRLSVNRELYFEEGELQVPAEFSPTPEETRAGFP